MAKKRTRTSFATSDFDDSSYAVLLAGVTQLLESARHAAARSVNSIITATYWAVGRRIVEEEQRGRTRAAYGDALVDDFRPTSPGNSAADSASSTSHRCENSIRHGQPSTLFRQRLKNPIYPRAQPLLPRFPLSWSHYVRLLSVERSAARAFYETQALRGGWTVRQLDRQIGTQFYERTLLSRNKAAMLRKGQAAQPEDALTPEQEIKDPFVLEFLNLKDEYSETDLEEALIQHLQTFLLELGDDYTFVGRQHRLRIDDEWFRIDLVFFHRRLRCLVLIDLKLTRLTAADVGQMHLYLNYARGTGRTPGRIPRSG